MNSIHFIPFLRCVLVHSVLFTPFSTNPSPYEPVMWGFNPYFWELPKTRPNSSKTEQRVITWTGHEMLKRNKLNTIMQAVMTRPCISRG